MSSPSTDRLSPLPDFLPDAEVMGSFRPHGSSELCGEHEERLSMFCVDDLEPICRQCCTTGSHAGHSIYPKDLTEAVTDCKEELRTSLEGLQQKMIHFENVTQTCDHASKHNQAQALLVAGQIKEEFEKLHQFLRDEEDARLLALREEQEQRKREVEERMGRKDETLEEKSRQVGEELDAEEGGGEFLQNYQTTSKRTCQGYTEPEKVCGPLIDVAKHLGNLRFAVWSKMKHIAPYTPVTLDPRTACQSLRVSPALNSVHVSAGQSWDMEQGDCVPANPERFHPYSCVLAREGYNSGTHCWDIEVGESNNWTIGVSRRSLCRREEYDACPEEGLWCISLRDSEYLALTTPAQILHLDKSHHLRRVHVRLDWDEGQLDFMDADTDAHIFKFTHRFDEEVYPYFESISMCRGLAVLEQRVNVSVGTDPIPVEGADVTEQDQVTQRGCSTEREITGTTDSSSKMLENGCPTTDKSPSTESNQTQAKGSTKAKSIGRGKKTDSRSPVKKQAGKTRFNVTYHVSLKRKEP